MFEVTDGNFQKEVLESNTPVLVDFWAEGCVPCKTLRPVLESIAKEYRGKLRVGNCKIDENLNTPSMFGIMSVPSVLIFKNGELISQVAGAYSKKYFKELIDSELKN
jgi:thioredoxin 1